MGDSDFVGIKLIEARNSPDRLRHVSPAQMMHNLLHSELDLPQVLQLGLHLLEELASTALYMLVAHW